jgi:hypothetical protein
MPTLSSLLLQREVATLREVDAALARQVVRGGDLCTNLLELARVDEAQLLSAIADAAGLEPMDPGPLPSPSPFALEKISASMAQRYALVPLFLDDLGLVVAVSEPLPPSVVEDFYFSTGIKLIQRVSIMARVRECISRAYRAPLDRRFARIVARLEGFADPSPTLHPPKPSLAASASAPLPAQPPLPEIDAVELSQAPAAGPSEVSPSPRKSVELSLPPIQGRRRRAHPPAPDSATQRRRGPFTLAMATEELGDAVSHNAILRVFFDFSRQFFDYSALFLVKGDLAEGSCAHGRGTDEDRIRGVGVPLELPSILSFARDRHTHVLVMPSSAGIDAVLRADLQRPMSASVLVVPIVVRNRVVALLYGDDSDSAVDIATVGDVLAFAPLVGAAFEELILRKKILGSNPPSSSPRHPSESEDNVASSGRVEAEIHELRWRDTEEPSYPVVAPFPSQPQMHLGPPPGQRRSITARLSAIPFAGAEVSPEAASVRQPEPFRAASDLPPPPDENDLQQAESVEQELDSTAVTPFIGDRVISWLAAQSVDSAEENPPIVQSSGDDSVSAIDAPTSAEPEPSNEQAGLAEALEAPGEPSTTESNPAVASSDAAQPAQEPAESASSLASPEQTASTEEVSAATTAADETEIPKEQAPSLSLAPSSAPVITTSVGELSGPISEDSPVVSVSDSNDGDADEMVQAVLAELERSPAPAAASKSNPFLDPHDIRESWVAQGAIVLGPQRIPRSNPPSDVGLPSVIVDVQGEVEALIGQLISRETSNAAAILAQKQLVLMRETSAKILFERLPGPLSIDPKADSDVFPRASECGPRLDLAVAMGLPFSALVSPTALTGDAQHRWWALLLMAEIGGKDAVEPIVRGLFDDDPLIRKASRSGARMLVGVHGLARAMAEPLQKVLLHERESMERRIAAVEIIGELHDARFVPVLLQTLGSPHASLRTACFGALRTLCRQDLPDEAAAWNDWWETNKKYPRVQWLIDAIGAKTASVREAASRELTEISGETFGFSPDLSYEECFNVQVKAFDWWRSMERNRQTDPPGPPHA